MPATGKETKEGRLKLEDVVISLQKSFSRVSAKSAEVPTENARSLVGGQVNFEITLRVDPEEDYLFFDPTGNVDLKISGVIDMDIRVVESE